MLKQISYLLKLKTENFLAKRKKKISNWEWRWWKLGVRIKGVPAPAGWKKIYGRLYWNYDSID